jgi:hypothetical protein
MGSRRLVFAVVTALVLAAPARAIAAPSAAQRETARRLMDEGKARARAGDKERAVEAYQKAHALMKVPTTGMAVAKAQIALGHLVEARDVALEVARMPRSNREPAVFERARKEARELEASLKPRIPTVRIVVKGGLATKVTVDAAEVAPLLLGEPVALDPGKHVVGAENAEGVEAHAEIDLAEREAREIELTLPVASPDVVVTTPAAEPTKRAPAKERRGERSTAGDVLVYGGFGLAAVGLAVGGITGALTLSKSGTVKSRCENGICDPAARSDLDSANAMASVSTIGFAVGGAGVVLGVVGLLLPKTTTTETALRAGERHAALWVGPGSMGVRGSF